MRLILQRVQSASVEVAGENLAAIEQGMLVLVGVEKGDSQEQAIWAANKLAGMRIFDDGQGRMNLDIMSVNGEILLVSQFTLAGSLEKGRRPSFDGAAPPAAAEPLVEELAENLERHGIQVSTGRFGAHMAVSLINDGPVTFVLDVPARSTTDSEQHKEIR